MKTVLGVLLAIIMLFIGGMLMVNGQAGAAPIAKSVGGVVTVTPVNGGYSTITHDLGAVPTGVLVTGIAPITGTNIPVGLMSDNYTATTFRIRALNQTGGAITTSITVAWQAFTGTTTPPPTTAPPTTTPPPTTVPPTTPPPTTTPPPAADCPAFPAHPDASCTGIRPGVVLADMPQSSIVSGGTYSGKRIATSGAITASNVTFIDCSFPNGAIFRSGTGITVTHSDFASDVYFSSYHTALFANNNVHDFSDGVDVTSDSGSVASNIKLIDNYIHKPTAVAPDHADGSQIRGVSGLTVQHNTIDMGVWYTSNGTNVLNSALFFENANGGNTGIVATNNYLNGGGYILYAPGGSGSITDNIFGPDGHFGYVYPTVDPLFTRSGNVNTLGQPVNF